MMEISEGHGDNDLQIRESSYFLKFGANLAANFFAQDKLHRRRHVPSSEVRESLAHASGARTK